MATLEHELRELKGRVERLEATVQRLGSDERQTTLRAPDELLDQEQLLT